MRMPIRRMKNSAWMHSPKGWQWARCFGRSCRRSLPKFEHEHEDEDELSRHDDAFGGLPARGGGQGFVGLIQSKAMGDHRVEWKLAAIFPEKLNGHFQMARLA